jgi:hypothetical protein
VRVINRTTKQEATQYGTGSEAYESTYVSTSLSVRDVIGYHHRNSKARERAVE